MKVGQEVENSLGWRGTITYMTESQEWCVVRYETGLEWTAKVSELKAAS